MLQREHRHRRHLNVAVLIQQMAPCSVGSIGSTGSISRLSEQTAESRKRRPASVC